MKPRVLFVDEDQERNGTTVSLEYLAEGFAGAGYDVVVLTWKVNPTMASRLARVATVVDARIPLVRTITLRVHFAYTASPFSPAGAMLILKDILKFVAGVVLILRAIHRHRPSLVYANEYSVVQAAVAARLCGVPSAVHVRSPMIRGAFGLRRMIIRRLVTGCSDAVFAITPLEAEQLTAGPGRRDRVRVVGEFVPDVPPAPGGEHGARESFGLSRAHRVVSMLGGIRDIKGTLDFLKAAEMLAGRGDVMFVVAGNAHLDGSAARQQYYDGCMEIARRLEQRDVVRLLGNIINPMDLILASDVIVSPSTDSHFARPVVEAWRLGRPVVAARTPHMEQLVRDGVDGLLVPRADAPALARAVDRLLDDGQLSGRLGAEGRRRAFAEYDAQTNCRTIISVCDRLRSRRGAPAEESRETVHAYRD